MVVVTTITELKSLLDKARAGDRTIGLVPTMGFFHEGHLSLIRRARRECDTVVVSLFVNPIQFGPAEDFEDYPRDAERDERQAAAEGADILFNPAPDEMYPEGFATYVEVEGPVARGLCADLRPGHFKGVTTVVTKLFNIVAPDRAYFGQKDIQQAAVIKRMTADLNLPLEIVVCPIVREADGLAMSSRNVYLGPEERGAAAVLLRALAAAEDMIAGGERDAAAVRDRVSGLISAEPLADLEYVAVCDTIDLNDVQRIKGDVLVAVAARIGKTRLIDNVIVTSD